MTRRNAGDQVPDFRMTADDGTTVSRDDLRGTRYVLYFYPEDDTPGCTAQASGLRDAWDRVAETGVDLYGVSPDSVASHVKFRAKYGLPYRLLSDEGHAAADAFGVWIEKSYAGRRYHGNERTTFVIDRDYLLEGFIARQLEEKFGPTSETGIVVWVRDFMLNEILSSTDENIPYNVDLVDIRPALKPVG
jgi:thioredoxin-dependent peroxiredoxin